ncbi:MAG: hypothetical protein AAGF81_11400 [Pseudomonadota bacterium]
MTEPPVIAAKLMNKITHAPNTAPIPESKRLKSYPRTWRWSVNKLCRVPGEDPSDPKRGCQITQRAKTTARPKPAAVNKAKGELAWTASWAAAIAKAAPTTRAKLRMAL